MSTTTNVIAEPAMQRLIDQVRAAQADASPLAIRGGGTKEFYGAIPMGDSLKEPAAASPLEVSPLRGICSYEPTEMVITVRAGTPLAEVEAALAEKGQHLAFEPPHFGPGGAAGTVGGMVAAGLSGPARAGAGGVRDFVLGACVLNGRAELLRFGGQVMKNVAGYDVSRTLAGSLGVLGVICEVSLKVPPVPAARTTLVFSCSQPQALEQLHRWAASALPISASAWYADRLHLRLAGAGAAVRSSTERLVKESGGKVLEDSAAQQYWAELRDQRGGFFGDEMARGAQQRLWRLSLPATHPPLGGTGETLLEWSGAQRWLYSDAPAAQMRALAARAHGHATLFRAPQRSADFQTPVSPALERIHRALKKSFDPAGIFNPGRLYPWL